MFNTVKAKNNAIEILKTYTGSNPYILELKRDVLVLQKVALLTDFAVEYVITNEKFIPRPVGKVFKIAEWFGAKLQEKYQIEFTPDRLQIFVCLGETSYAYHCTVKYRKNMNPMSLFIPKKALWGELFVKDYHDFQVDFDRFDRLSMAKDPNRKLMPHQRDAVKFLLSRKKCIIADEMGLGKSLSLSVAAIEGNFDSVLIICPASLKTNWKKELMWYVPEKDISIIESLSSKTKPELEKALGYAEGKSGLSLKELQNEAKGKGQWVDNRFVIINFDILDEFYKIPASRSKANIEQAFKESPMLQYIAGKKSLIIVDESHRLSNSTSIRYKVIKDMIKRGNPDSIYLATGTPVTNNPANLFCLLQLIENTVSADWQYYMERYCGAIKMPAKGEKEKWTNRYLQRVHRPDWYSLSSEQKEELKAYIRANARMITIAKDGTNLEELKNRISHIYLRRTKEDVISNLPQKRIHEVLYDFDAIQQMEYAKLWDEYETAQLEADPTKEINKDLLEGAIYRRYCSNQMVPNTIRLADEHIAKGEKVIIVTCYDDELNTIKDYYGDKCVVYNGKMSAKQKDEAQRQFIENPDIMVFIGQIIAAGVGLTLVVSHVVIYNNFSFVPGDCRQMEDRTYRIGQTHDVDIYYQIFQGTQYEKIWNTVMKKELLINQIIKTENEK